MEKEECRTVFCPAQAGCAGKERSRLAMGRWLKLLGTQQWCPFQERKNREKESRAYHTSEEKKVEKRVPYCYVVGVGWGRTGLILHLRKRGG